MNTKRLLQSLLLLILPFALWSQDLSSPYNTIESHLQNLQPGQYRPGLSSTAIHPSIEDSITRIRIAVELKSILDAKGLFVIMSQVPRRSNFVDSLTGNEIFTLFPLELPEIYVEKLGENWYYSENSSNAVEQLYEDIFPAWLQGMVRGLPFDAKKKFLGVAIWKYLGIALILIAAFLLHLLLEWIFDKLLSKTAWNRFKIGDEDFPKIHRLAQYFSLTIILFFIRSMLPSLVLDIKISNLVYTLLNVGQTIFISLACVQLVKLGMIYLRSLASKTESKMDDQLLPVVIKIIILIIYIVMIIRILSLLDVNVTALIAGVSIGGLALALAAQDTVKNFLGSVMIFFDKPFQIGDYINTGEVEGTVEEVGFRSTRIRKVDTALISVPNGNLANVTLTNLGVRQFRIFNLTLGFTYDSKSEDLKKFITELKSMIKEDDRLSQENWYVNLKNLSASSIDVMYRVYIDAPSYKDELNIKEDIIFKLIKLAEDNNLSFAFPSQSLYIEKK